MPLEFYLSPSAPSGLLSSARSAADRGAATAILFVLALASVVACKKDSATATPASESAATPQVQVELVSAQPAPARQVAPKVDPSAGTLLRYLPRGSSIVVGLNWTKARGSSFVSSLERDLAAQIPEIARIKAHCGMDPIVDVQSLALALGQDPEDPNALVVAVYGDFQRDEIEDCIRRLGGTVEGARYNGTTNVFWPAADTVVLSRGVSSEELAMTHSVSAWDHEELMVLVDEIDLHAELWAAGLLPPEVAGAFGTLGAAPIGAHLTVNVASGLRATLGLEFASEEDAERVSKMVAQGIEMAKAQSSAKGLGF